MRNVTYSMGVSLDGYVAGPDGDLNWTDPDPELFRFITEETGALSAYLLGRRLYETMLYWESTERDDELDDDRRAWAAMWRALPKVVFSRTLSAVVGHARLATGTLAEEIERLRDEPGEGDIAIGGPTLAGEAARLGLIDEYCPRVSPVVIGGGLPYYPLGERRVDVELLSSRTFPSRTVVSRYRVRR